MTLLETEGLNAAGRAEEVMDSVLVELIFGHRALALDELELSFGGNASSEPSRPQREQCFEPLLAFVRVAANHPEAAHRRAQPQTNLVLTSGDAPAHGCPYIAILALQSVEPLGLLGSSVRLFLPVLR